jgi:hypothetical protein
VSRAWARPALVLLALLGPAFVPAGAQAGWSAPFDLVAPGSLDYLPTQLAVSASGSAAGYAVQDVDTPGSAQAYLVLRSPGGGVGPPQVIPGAREVLALAYSGRGLELLTGSSPAGLDCCSSTQAVAVAGAGQLQSAQTLVSGLTGATIGSLVPLARGAMLAVVATEGGLWTQQSGSGGRFTGRHRLTGASLASQEMSATSLGASNSLVAWTAASGPAGTADPRTIFYAQGSKRSSPRRAHTLLRVPAGHRIEELGVAQRGGGATAAWIESYYDQRANYHVQVRAADFAAHPSVRGFSVGGGLAAGISFAADAQGAQGLAWKACGADGNCTVRVTTRGPSSPFHSSVSLGSIDPAQTPSLSVSPHGQVVIGWVRAGHPVAVVGPARSGNFGAVQVLSTSVYALDETVAYGPSGALAAWTQGTLNPSVVAASYR